jgi:hypothetical protein
VILRVFLVVFGKERGILPAGSVNIDGTEIGVFVVFFLPSGINHKIDAINNHWFFLRIIELNITSEKCFVIVLKLLSIYFII